jgi:hypothetical protein
MRVYRYDLSLTVCVVARVFTKVYYPGGVGAGGEPLALSAAAADGLVRSGVVGSFLLDATSSLGCTAETGWSMRVGLMAPSMIISVG